MPHPDNKSSRPSCLLLSLHHHLSLGRVDLAVDALPLLACRGLRPDLPTLALLLSQCLRSGSLPLARRVHLFLRLSGFKRSYPWYTPLSNHLLAFHFLRGRPSDARRLFARMPHPNLFSFNAMLAGYARVGLLRHARRLFDRMPHRDVVSWNTMIIALARAGSFRDAVGLYSQLRHSSLGFNPHTFSGLLIACNRLRDMGLIRQVHAQVFLLGFLSNLIISSSLVDAYAKCGYLDYARKLFDEMPTRDVLAWTTLVHGFANCGDLVSARTLFDGMPDRNPVSWTALIGGYTRHGHPLEALDLFRGMMSWGVRPDQFTFSSSLCACAAIASLKHGKQIHARLLRTRFNPNAIVLSSLIDMYSKCGDLAGGRWVFDLTDPDTRDTVLWNTMMSAVGQHGLGREAIRMFEEMISALMKPDANTFVVLLSACSHSGLVAEGLQLFKSMAQSHHIVPEEDHYVCLVDLLGRAGCFKEVMEWLGKMPLRSSCRAWNALLGACRIHRNLQLGREVAGRLLKLEPHSSAAYVLLSNICADVGNWETVEKVRHIMQEKKVRKERAASWIEVDHTVHFFGASDHLHPSKEDIYAALEQLVSQMDDDSSIT
uniref:Pentatricopeptide repeat-containing protein At2g21090 n=1 Tax=Elaeis guineensis var. tenera TaxID=51953 RepID=A0A6I9R5U8_ELAGV|nr:pentatricopeptide repeat-containing protein At2g21090 [Elaeis guineensis]XP_010920184.1 pentatricopeptide repeat-containing protein At2g21090 [Elaeis guineensis]